MRYPRQPKYPHDLARALRELRRLRAKLTKAEAEAIARQRKISDGRMERDNGGNDGGEAP